MPCKVSVCSLYENLYSAVRPDGGKKVIQHCEAFTYYNATMCLDEYRDVDHFCSCFWRGKMFWPERFGFDQRLEPIQEYHQVRSSVCAKPAMEHMLVYKRFMTAHPALRTATFVEGCMSALCNWMYELADPYRYLVYENAQDYLYAPPRECQDMELPIKKDQCNVLTRSDPYDVCPWESPANDPENDRMTDTTYECFDGSFCDYMVDGYGCCFGPKWGKMRCNTRHPVMCRLQNHCDGASDHCCVKNMKDCHPDGAMRQCAPLFNSLTEEQRGEVPLLRRQSYYEYLLSLREPDRLAQAFAAATTETPAVFETIRSLTGVYILGGILAFLAMGGI